MLGIRDAREYGMATVPNPNGNAVYGANGEHSRFKPQRGQESRRLHCLTRDREYELVTKAYGIGESHRGEQKIKM